MFYIPVIPSWFMKLNASMVWKMPAVQKELYLTFDDGPHESVTPFVLDQLKLYNAKATFFCIGKNVRAHPKIYERILDEGHITGNHTYNHLNGWKTKTNLYLKDITEAAHYIDSRLFRPPYGKISPFLAKILIKKLHYKVIMWHVLSGDFDERITPQKCLENVLLYCWQGSIIVFHDSAKAWPRLSFTLPKILQHFSNEGFVFKAISI